MKMTSVGTIGSNKGIKVRNLFFKWNNESIYDEQWTFQATEGIIKHLEKIDAEPEEEMDVPDETTDFTLFDVSCCLKLIYCFVNIFILKVTKDDTTLIDNTTQNMDATTFSFDDWGRF